MQKNEDTAELTRKFFEEIRRRSEQDIEEKESQAQSKDQGSQRKFDFRERSFVKAIWR